MIRISRLVKEHADTGQVALRALLVSAGLVLTYASIFSAYKNSEGQRYKYPPIIFVQTEGGVYEKTSVTRPDRPFRPVRYVYYIPSRIAFEATFMLDESITEVEPEFLLQSFLKQDYEIYDPGQEVRYYSVQDVPI